MTSLKTHPTAPNRKPYTPPSLTQHGDIYALTRDSTFYHGALFGITSGTKGVTPQLPDAPTR